MSKNRLGMVARAICKAEPAAPKPDSTIQIGMKEHKAWEGRRPMAEAAIAVVKDEVLNAVRRAGNAYPDDLFPPDSPIGQAGKIAPMIINRVIENICTALASH